MIKYLYISQNTFMVLFYKAITYILKSSYRAKEGLLVGLIHRPALLASQIYRLCTRRRSERFGDNSIISAMQLVNVGLCLTALNFHVRVPMILIKRNKIFKAHTIIQLAVFFEKLCQI